MRWNRCGPSWCVSCQLRVWHVSFLRFSFWKKRHLLELFLCFSLFFFLSFSLSMTCAPPKPQPKTIPKPNPKKYFSWSFFPLKNLTLSHLSDDLFDSLTLSCHLSQERKSFASISQEKMTNLKQLLFSRKSVYNWDTTRSCDNLFMFLFLLLIQLSSNSNRRIVRVTLRVLIRQSNRDFNIHQQTIKK